MKVSHTILASIFYFLCLASSAQAFTYYDISSKIKNQQLGTEYNHFLYFSSLNANGVSKLYKTNGTTITLVSDTAGDDTVNDSPSAMVVFNSRLYFSSLNANSVCKWYSLGTDDVIKQVAEFSGDATKRDCIGYSQLLSAAIGGDVDLPVLAIPAMRAIFSEPPVVANSALYIQAFDSTDTPYLYKFDGTTAVKLSSTKFAGHMIAFENRLFFTGLTAGGKQKIFSTDSTQTIQMSNLFNGDHDLGELVAACKSGGLTIATPRPLFQIFNSALYFVGTDPTTCRQKVYRLKKK